VTNARPSTPDVKEARMRRTLVTAIALGVAALGWVPTAASANHSCAEGFEIVCFAGCPSPPKICPWN
jgi:hypothetical protein